MKSKLIPLLKQIEIEFTKLHLRITALNAQQGTIKDPELTQFLENTEQNIMDIIKNELGVDINGIKRTE